MYVLLNIYTHINTERERKRNNCIKIIKLPKVKVAKRHNILYTNYNR